MDAGRLFTGLFPRTYIVNLAHRADRRREIAAELGRIGLAPGRDGIEIFEAVKPAEPGPFPSIGARGCFLSHLEILRRIAAGAAPVALILEDDAGLAPDAAARLPTLAPAIGAAGWDLLYGYYSSARGDAPEAAPGLRRLPPGDEILTSHFVAVGRDTAARIVPYLEAMLERPLGDPAGGPMHVDGAYNWFRRAHPATRCLALDPPLATQRPSRSDIHPSRIDRVPGLAPLATAARRLRRALGGR